MFGAKDNRRENGEKKQYDVFSQYLPLIFKEGNIFHNKDLCSKIN